MAALPSFVAIANQRAAEPGSPADVLRRSIGLLHEAVENVVEDGMHIDADGRPSGNLPRLPKCGVTSEPCGS